MPGGHPGNVASGPLWTRGTRLRSLGPPGGPIPSSLRSLVQAARFLHPYLPCDFCPRPTSPQGLVSFEKETSPQVHTWLWESVAGVGPCSGCGRNPRLASHLQALLGVAAADGEPGGSPRLMVCGSLPTSCPDPVFRTPEPQAWPAYLSNNWVFHNELSFLTLLPVRRQHWASWARAPRSPKPLGDFASGHVTD